MRFLIERISVSGERLDFTVSPAGDPPQAFLDTLDLIPIDGERVQLDTSKTQLQSVNFRGVLELAVRVRRQQPSGSTDVSAKTDADVDVEGTADPSTDVIFDVVFESLGSFEGLVPDRQQSDGSDSSADTNAENIETNSAATTWLPLRGRADRMDAEVRMQLAEGAALDPQVQTLVLIGDEQPAELTIERTDEIVTWQSRRLELLFDQAGVFMGVKSGRDTIMSGRPRVSAGAVGEEGATADAATGEPAPVSTTASRGEWAQEQRGDRDDLCSSHASFSAARDAIASTSARADCG